ncbi:hypothetical protein [Paenibacillus daejeonensis]|uniref:hypothetical protein n=1 Tax=Paenibacillus daejeonensis TaxID=135193 RepID=UPI00036E1FC7|nr:hypothetical protein [Paenibacillus daejeonensis]
MTKTVLIACMLFVVLFVLIQFVANAILSAFVADSYLKSLLTLLLSIGVAFYMSREFVQHRKNPQRLR